jgi:hypothetical protein
MLCDLNTVRQAMALLDPDQDGELTRLIGAASAAIENFIGRPVRTMTVAETVRTGRWERCDEIVLHYSPVTSIVSIVENGTTLTTSDYGIDQSTGLLMRSSAAGPYSWPRWGRHVVVTYTTGWDVVPADIEAACVTLVAASFGQAARDPNIKSERSEGVGITEYFAPSTPGLDGSLRATLNRYVSIPMSSRFGRCTQSG